MPLKEMRPLPVSDFDVHPCQEEVDRFQRDGFLAVERLTTDEELEWLTELYEHIFDPANASDRGAPVDRSTGVDGDPTLPLVTQAFMPEFNYPELLRTTFQRNARRYAAALLQVDEREISSWGHMIRKAPGAREASWHQDEAFWEPEFEYHAIGCWLPMHDVDEQMGTMQFIPGSHRNGVLPHRAKDDDAVLHVLYADIDPAITADRVVCPLKAGGATFHDARTLHYTAPNGTDRPRLAFPTEFEVAPRRRAVPEVRPWVDEWRAATNRPAPTGYVGDGKFIPI
jgi:hypothetical protein